MYSAIRGLDCVTDIRAMSHLAASSALLRPVLLASWDGEQRGFRGRRDLDCSAPRVWWLRTPLRRKAEVQGTRLRKPRRRGRARSGTAEE